jgi:hypothetical protein
MAGGGSSFHQKWMELFFIVLMILGIIIALSASSALVSYILILLAGILAGRVIYERKGKIKFPHIVIIIGFLLGYIIGAYYGNRKFIAVLFILGAMIGYKFYDKGWLSDIRF